MTVLTTRVVRLPMPRRAAAVLLTFGVFVGVLAIIHRPPEQHLSKPAAVASAMRTPEVREHLARYGWDRARTTPLDDRLLRVSFFEGPRVVLEAAVAPDGHVVGRIPYSPGYVRIGGEAAQRPLVLAVLLAVFVLATAAAPLRSLRNLDVLALASFAVPIVLMNARLLEASVYTSYPPLAYLCARCAYVAFRGPPAAGPPRPLVAPSRGWLRVAVVAAALGLVLLAVPSGLVSDVAFASMAGATDLVHGTLPYGRLAGTELVHGDTYPLLAYAAYVPAALITPVKGAFDHLDGALWVAAGFALAGAVAMARAGGARLALAWLSFPPVVIAASAGSNDVVAAACVAWAVALMAHAGRSSLALTIAGWVKLGPLVALPAWLARRRGAGFARGALAAVALTAVLVAWVAALGGLGDMVHALSFQAERGSLLSLWTLTGWSGGRLVAQAAVATLVVFGALARLHDPVRAAALAGAVLLGLQLAANYWTYAYLPWVFPLVAVSLLSGRLRPARRPAAHP